MRLTLAILVIMCASAMAQTAPLKVHANPVLQVKSELDRCTEQRDYLLHQNILQAGDLGQLRSTVDSLGQSSQHDDAAYSDHVREQYEEMIRKYNALVGDYNSLARSHNELINAVNTALTVTAPNATTFSWRNVLSGAIQGGAKGYAHSRQAEIMINCTTQNSGYGGSYTNCSTQ